MSNNYGHNRNSYSSGQYNVPKYTPISLDSIWNENLLREKWDNEIVDPVEGIYVDNIINVSFKFGVLRKSARVYKIIYLTGVDIISLQNWREGDIIAELNTDRGGGGVFNWNFANNKINEIPIKVERNEFIISEIEEIGRKFYRIYPYETYSPIIQNPPVMPDANSVIPKTIPKRNDYLVISSGTGFVLNQNGFIITNYHVIENAKIIMIKGINEDFNNSNEALIYLFDRNNDIAILKLKDDNISIKNIPYDFKASISDVGESIFILGYPLRSSMGDEVKITDGIISSNSGYAGDISLYQITAPVQPGNSGGPLFDSNGSVIGIISAKHKEAQNVSYAIKISFLNNLINISNKGFILNINNSISNLSLSEKIKRIRGYVYIIECFE
jgi:S1-C subfamily serine protease